MGNKMLDWLVQFFDEVTPRRFYRDLFPEGEMEKAGEMVRGRYNAIALCVSTKEKKQKTRLKKSESGARIREKVWNADGTPMMVPKVFRYTMTDDHDILDELCRRDDLFCLMAPLTYVGKQRTAENARMMYAMTFDLDNLRVYEDGTPIGLLNLWNGHITAAERIPKPTYIVASGNGLHLYYMFERAIPLFPNVVKQLEAMKRELTEIIWNEGIVDLGKGKIQQEGIYQGFRVVGTRTKHHDGSVARAFQTGDKVTIEYLNGFVRPEFQVTEFAYKSQLTKAEAKEKYPEWYEERIEKHNKGVLKPWHVSRRLYDWWKKEILRKATVGHRYYCLMILAAYAQKCSFYDAKKNPNPVTYEELEADAFEIMSFFDTLGRDETERFTEVDVLAALDSFDWGMLSYPRNSVEYRAGFALPHNARNRRKQEAHLERARAVQKIDYPNGEWRKENGRHSKEEIIREWRAANPDGRKADCIRETGLTKPTVYKWWDPGVVKYVKKKEGEIMVSESAAEYNAEPRFPVDFGDGDKIYMTKAEIDEYNHRHWHKELPEFYVIEGDPKMGEKIVEMTMRGARSVEILSPAEYKYLSEKKAKG